MWWRSNGSPKCPRCGGRMSAYMEAEAIDGVKRVRYVLRCKACGFRTVLQDVSLKKTPRGVCVSVIRTRF